MKFLKSIAAMLIISALSTVGATAQSTSPDITVTKHVDQSADAVWAQLRSLDNIDELSSFVAKVDYKGNKGVGGERVCTAPDGQGQFRESITKFSDAERSYSYAVVEGVPAKNMVNSFKVVDLGYNKSLVVWTSNYTFMENPNMTLDQFKGFLTGASTEMIDNAVKFAAKSSHSH